MKYSVEDVVSFVQRNSVLFAAVAGMDKMPRMYVAEMCCVLDGVMYFAVGKSERYYGELSLSPLVHFGAYDEERQVALLLKGNVVFSEDQEIVSRCLEGSESLRKQWGKEPGMVIAYFLKDAVAEFVARDGGKRITVEMGTPENVLIGITIKKDKEIRDRLVAIMARREAESVDGKDENEIARQKLYDGAVLYVAETAKDVWPRMDIGPIERCALFETYDEREKYVRMAKRIMGNARIDKPEDLSYWLNEQTLSGNLTIF